MCEENKEKRDFGPYTLQHRQALMKIAKESVKSAVIGQLHSSQESWPAELTQDAAAFVTLKKHGKLRGCIGHVTAVMPLFKCVDEMARAAAVNDTRFNPVLESELENLDFEISILTKPVTVKPEDVVVGKDGLIISQGGRSGLLLPQVPVELRWTKEEFLAGTCRKAGLPLNCWRDAKTEIKAFRAIVFNENDIL